MNGSKIETCLCGYFVFGDIQLSFSQTTTLSTVDPSHIAAFQTSKTVLGFDEIVVPSGPCFIVLDRNRFAPQGVTISVKTDGSDQKHVARLPDCGHFGTNYTSPNIIAGGSSASGLGWREAIRFDFPSLATSIGAQTDLSGSNTTLTAYNANGVVIVSVSTRVHFWGLAPPVFPTPLGSGILIKGLRDFRWTM